MLRLQGLRGGFAVAVACFCMAAVMGQQIPTFSGSVQKVGGAGLPHATVRIEGAGSTETSDSGEFTFPLSGSLKIGFPAVFHVTNWVILKPCELKNGRTYLRDPAAEPIGIFVLPPGDPRLKFPAPDSIIECLIEEKVSQLTLKFKPSAGRRSSLPKEGYPPFGTRSGRKEFVSGIDLEPGASYPRLVEAAYHPPAARSSSRSFWQEANDADPASEGFLARKAKVLGFSVQELESAIEAWTKSVEDPYQKGLAALYAGRYAEATQYVSESLIVCEDISSRRSVPLAIAEYWQGHYPAAESALRKVLAAHPDDPIIQNNLASVLVAEARFSEAEPLFKRSLAIAEEEVGPDHREVVIVLNNLATLFEDHGRYSEAEPLYERALAIDEKALGPSHRNVATELNNLAWFYTLQGKYSEAEPLFKRALAIDEKILGQEHPNLATELNNLAGLYFNLGKYSEAEPLLQRALAIDEKTLGPNHPDVATILSDLAWLYDCQGKYSEAELLFKRALEVQEKELGKNHPAFANSLNGLAWLYEDQGNYNKAEPLFKRALAIREKALGTDHPAVADSLNGLARVYDDQGKYNMAEPLYKRALAIREKALGPDHPDVATTLNGLATVYYHLGQYGEAEPLHERALAIDEKALGPNHPHVADVAESLARTLRKLGHDTEAKAFEEQAAKIREKSK